ncbi:hypothetical protein E2C01_081023 [Portunus trituberculatus]|uniref:Uncharacterized protein n=1 Tax=Portunus trituberculatus TaxID=210409 RepID=A0A5B7IUQ4_PORTR|nr:hypothetical protein [Portunus trituberculatus]
MDRGNRDEREAEEWMAARVAEGRGEAGGVYNSMTHANSPILRPVMGIREPPGHTGGPAICRTAVGQVNTLTVAGRRAKQGEAKARGETMMDRLIIKHGHAARWTSLAQNSWILDNEIYSLISSAIFVRSFPAALITSNLLEPDYSFGECN